MCVGGGGSCVLRNLPFDLLQYKPLLTSTSPVFWDIFLSPREREEEEKKDRGE